MTVKELVEIFDSENGEFLKFHKVKEKLSNRPDLHAFLLIDKLVPGDTDIIGGAEHDEIYIWADLEELAKVITREQVVDLCRCGVLYSKPYDTLFMFT